MSTIPTLSTPRLRLRAFTLADLDAYAAMCADEEVMRHIGSGGVVGRDVVWRQLAMFLGQWALLGYGKRSFSSDLRAGMRLPVRR